LDLPVCGHDDGLINSLVDARFEEQGDVVDYHRFRILTCGLLGQPCLLTCHAGMNDGFERTAFRWMAKDYRSEGVAIEAAIWIQDAPPERFHDLAPGRFPRLHDVPSQFVGIDHDCSASPEHLGDSALARGHSSRQSHQNHRRKGYTRLLKKSSGVGRRAMLELRLKAGVGSVL
jgi:hypothetical protein